MDDKTKHHVLARLIEFFIIGVLLGIGEDLIAIHFATDAQITWHVFKVAFFVAVPFAIVSELIADSKIFKKLLQKKKKKN